jgi:hypothetical protein
MESAALDELMEDSKRQAQEAVREATARTTIPHQVSVNKELLLKQACTAHSILAQLTGCFSGIDFLRWRW